MFTRSVSGLPMLEVAQHGRCTVGCIRKLQRQAARGIGRQLQQADAIERAAGQGRQVLAGCVRQFELADGLGITTKGGGEGFAHRANFEQRVLVTAAWVSLAATP